MSKNKSAELQKILREVENLRASPLYEYRKENGYLPVIGEGDPDAEIMFIGEAPGKSEAESGRPFVGAAGKLLDRLLASIGMEREKVYITNIVKDRPPENRDPKPEEIALYAPFLLRQIEIIQPKVIATLGRFSMDFIMEQFDAQEKGEKISKLHGKALDIQAPHGKVILVPLFHPAFALYRRDQKEALEEDFRRLKKYI